MLWFFNSGSVIFSHLKFMNKLLRTNQLVVWLLLQLNVPCDENEQHTAVLYCVTCGSNLCLECSNMTHSARTLAKHKRVPLSEKPQEYPKCARHPMHLVEFACLEEECQGAPLMCYICKDYGRHVQHKVRSWTKGSWWFRWRI